MNKIVFLIIIVKWITCFVRLLVILYFNYNDNKMNKVFLRLLINIYISK